MEVPVNTLFVSSNGLRGSECCSDHVATRSMTDVAVALVQKMTLGAKAATPALERNHAYANEVIEARRALIAALEERRRTAVAA